MLQQVQQQNVWVEVKNIKSRKCQKFKTLKDKKQYTSRKCQKLKTLKDKKQYTNLKAL